MMRGSAKFIIQKYQHQIGYPSLPPYHALGIYTGSQLDPAWANPEEIQKKVEAYIAANMPIEGVLLDQYTAYKFCPFQADKSFNIADMQTFLHGKDMKMYLAIQAGIQVGDVLCLAYEQALEAAEDCLLARVKFDDDQEKYTVGLGKLFGTAGDKAEDFYGMALVDVFGDGADVCMKALFDLLLASESITPDGIYLRDNSPFTISNGTDLNITHYIKNTTRGNA